MTNFSIEQFQLDAESVKTWSDQDDRHHNWPVVYTLNSDSEIYIGESLNASSRMRQHLESTEKRSLRAVKVVLDDTFNKSVCLDLESYLIQLLSGDGKYKVLNRNDGIVNAEYYGRSDYRTRFAEIVEQLRSLDTFTKSIAEIQNSALFKLSPFKALNEDQAIAVEAILSDLLRDLDKGVKESVVVQGDPGTGKTVVAIFIIKLLRDIASLRPGEREESDSVFANLFVDANRILLQDLRIAFVVPQQSLRKSIQDVFKNTPGIDPEMVVSPIEVGLAEHRYDLILVDETHRLRRRSNESSAMANHQFRDINMKLFGKDDLAITQLDWIKRQSDQQIFFVDPAQSIRPADIPLSIQMSFIDAAREVGRFHRLASQMRIIGGSDYVAYVRDILNGRSPKLQSFGDYEFRMFDNLAEMRSVIFDQNDRVELSRLIAGYGWKWLSKSDKTAYDFALDGCLLRWNSTDKDWINSSHSIEEVGSIHTVQGFDLNYAGVIIASDLRYDVRSKQIIFDRKSYFDTKGKENNGILGIKYSDDDLLKFVRNIYSVLLTRGVLGTYVYVVDPALRKYLSNFIPLWSSR